jgi:hypothetical protein
MLRPADLAGSVDDPPCDVVQEAIDRELSGVLDFLDTSESLKQVIGQKAMAEAGTLIGRFRRTRCGDDQTALPGERSSSRASIDRMSRGIAST